MKIKLWNSTACVAITLILPAGAATIYSGLLDTPILTTFTGTTVNVGDGTLNPFFGGVGVANNDKLQPFRLVAGNSGKIQDFGVGDTIDASVLSSLFLGTGYGGSQTHLGSTFTADQEGYLGFRLDGTNYGWMRVVFTANTSGAVVKDWAYENGGGAIHTGNVLQSGSVVTLDSTLGAFTLGSEVGSSNSVVKDGANSATLIGTNGYSGTTTVNAGSLLVTGSTTGSGVVTVGGGAPVATLGGTGSLAGAVTVNDHGVLAPGTMDTPIESLASGALTFNTGSTFAYDMNSSFGSAVAADLQIVNGNTGSTNLYLNGIVKLILADVTNAAFAPNTTTLSLIQYGGGWNGGFFTYGESNVLENNEEFTDIYSNHWKITYNADSGGANLATSIPGSHFITLSNLTAVPEPGSLLALGCLLGSGMFLRRRR